MRPAYLCSLTESTEPNNQNALATPEQPLFDVTNDLHYF
jgi:hypothetical protein